MRSLSAISRLIACVLISSVLAITLAPVWHAHAHAHLPTTDGCHHDCGDHADDSGDANSTPPGERPAEDREHDCGICIAMSTPLGGAPPAAAVVFVQVPQTVARQAHCAAAPSIESGPVLFSCGPPRG